MRSSEREEQTAKMKNIIETERLVLRPFDDSDLDLIESLYCDEEVLRFTPFDTATEEQAGAHLQKIIADWSADPLSSLEFVMIRKEDGQKIGRCHILIENESGHESGMIGWMIKKEFRGRQYAYESGSALICYCKENLHLHRVHAVCNPENTASRKVLEKLGMEIVRYGKCRYVKNGAESWVDELKYAKTI